MRVWLPVGRDREDDSGLWLVARCEVAVSPGTGGRKEEIWWRQTGAVWTGVEAQRGVRGESSKWFEVQV